MSCKTEGTLPAGWTTPSLADCCEVIAGVGFPEHLQGIVDAEIPFYKVSDISKAWQAGSIHLDSSPNTVTIATARSLASRLVPAATVVFAKIGAAISLNRRALTTKPCLVDNNIMGLHPASSVLDPVYLFFITCTLRLNDYSRATTVPSIRKGDVETVRFPLPPTPEQHRIVQAIESYFTRLDDAVATLERVQRNLNRYRASVLKAAVEGRLVPTEAELARAEGRDYEPASVLLERILAERRRRWQETRARCMYAEPAAPDSSELPELPGGWCWATLPQLGELKRGKSRHRPRNDPRLLGGPYPFVQTGDVKKADGFIAAHEATYSEFGLAQSRLWPAGTVCITIAANIAETGILAFDACFPDSVVGFLSTDALLARYVELFLRTARRGLHQYAPGTAQKNINLETLSAVAVPLPPAAERDRIVAELDRQLSVASHCCQVAVQGVARCRRLRQSILKWAFEGRLADQDPADEPTSVLLERIQAEREAAEPRQQARHRARQRKQP